MDLLPLRGRGKCSKDFIRRNNKIGDGKQSNSFNYKKGFEAATARKLQMNAIPDIELEGEWGDIPFGSFYQKRKKLKSDYSSH